MTKTILYLFTILLLFSCNNDSEKLIVNGHIKGLKKGIVYLKKVNDTVLVTLDSLVLNGKPNFTLKANIDAPEVFYLFLDKNDNTKNGISFFGNKGITEITTSLENFLYDAKIKGSKQQNTYSNYLNMLAKFNEKNLDLIENNLNAKIKQDSKAIISSEKQLKNLTRRKYLYTANYAITNKNSEVAPYIAITQMHDANIKLLDTINNSLSANIKVSKYGKALQEFINKIKKTPQQTKQQS